MKAGTIAGFHYNEERLQARFIVSNPWCLPYLNFGSRIVETVYDHFPTTLYVVGVPQEHAQYVFDRLGSGLIRRAGPFDTLEEALDQARLGL